MPAFLSQHTCIFKVNISAFFQVREELALKRAASPQNATRYLYLSLSLCNATVPHTLKPEPAPPDRIGGASEEEQAARELWRVGQVPLSSFPPKGYLAQKKQPPPQDHRRALGTVLLYGHRTKKFLMSEVPL